MYFIYRYIDYFQLSVCTIIMIVELLMYKFVTIITLTLDRSISDREAHAPRA